MQANVNIAVNKYLLVVDILTTKKTALKEIGDISISTGFS